MCVIVVVVEVVVEVVVATVILNKEMTLMRLVYPLADVVDFEKLMYLALWDLIPWKQSKETILLTRLLR